VKTPCIKLGERGQGKNDADTDLQKIVGQYGTTEVLDPGGTAFSEPTFAETIPFMHSYGTTVGGGVPLAPFSKDQGQDRAKQAKKKPHHL